MPLRSTRPATPRHRRRRVGSALGLTVAVSTALVPLAGTAAAATIEVANYVALTAAVAPGCQDGTVLRATGDMAEGNLTVLTVSCDVTLDINGHYLQIGPVVIGTG